MTKAEKMAKAEREIEKASEKTIKIAHEYNVSPSSVVWMGGNRFIVVNGGCEFIIEK